VANAEYNARKTREYNDALSMLQVWQDDWLKWLLSKSSHDGGTKTPKTPAPVQHEKLMKALDSIPDPMERWVKLRNDIMIPQKKNYPVKNQEHFRVNFLNFYKDVNPFEGLTADPASSHMDTEEFFDAAFQNSPAVRRAYEEHVSASVQHARSVQHGGVLRLRGPIARRVHIQVRESSGSSRGCRGSSSFRLSRRAFGGVALRFTPLLP